MGIFSKVKKTFKKVVKGVKKVFKKVVEKVGKFLNSKLGKAILLGVTIVTGGMALYGAVSGMSANLAAIAGKASFLDKFAAGASGFLKGGMAGMKAAGQMMGQGLTGKFAEAGKTFMGVGDAARTAATGIGQAANTVGSLANATPDASSIVDPQQVLQGGGPTATGAEASKFTTMRLGEFAPEAGQQFMQASAPAAETTGLLTQAAGEAAKEAAPTFLQKMASLGGTVAKNAGAAVTSPGGMVMAGNLATSMGSYMSDKEDREEAENKLKQGWTRDRFWNPQQAVLGGYV